MTTYILITNTNSNIMKNDGTAAAPLPGRGSVASPRWLYLTSTRGLDAHHRKYNRFLVKLSIISINVNVRFGSLAGIGLGLS